MIELLKALAEHTVFFSALAFTVPLSVLGISIVRACNTYELKKLEAEQTEKLLNDGKR